MPEKNIHVIATVNTPDKTQNNLNINKTIIIHNNNIKENYNCVNLKLKYYC